ncbi:YkgJ family cysteine cluster protein [Chitinimonas naiadis]
MTDHRQTIRFLRNHIPSFECVPGCHDCCGPVTTSSEEMSRLPRKTAAEQEAALRNLSCPHLGECGCQVYAERPLICRLFGTTPRLACPHGRGPAQAVDTEIEQAVYHFFRQTRQVLV